MLAIDDLHKTYGDVVALDGCTFTVVPGRLLGFLGPNGAGKTTTMRAIFGLVTPDRGSVSWEGRPVEPSDRIRFGYMPEVRGLYPKMRVLDQLTYLGRLHGLKKDHAAREAGALLSRLGLEDRASDQLEKLSHGNQQRVQLAAALINRPQLLVLDEPFSGLDPLGVETMAEVLRERAQEGAAVLFSSHQLDLVEDLCEDVAIINRGRIVRAGSVTAIKDSSPIRHLEVEMAQASDGVLDHVPGVIHFETQGNRHRMLVPAALDIRGVLGEALATGQVRRFIYTTPSLSEIFLETVA